MIVLSTRGRGGVAKLVLGSDAEDMFRKAPCPVMTVGPQVSPPPDCMRTILCPTDFSHDCAAALPYAVARACMLEGRLILLHALYPEMIGPDTPRPLLRQRATERLLGVLPEATGLAEPEIVVEFGAAPELILRTAAERKADLIIMGVHAPAGLHASPHLPWSTAHKVICQAHCPVLTVRA
jgi:nucleotide-binding universal stress UspA family protein